MAVFNPAANLNGLDDDCFEQSGITQARTEDYLFIPQATIELPGDPAGTPNEMFRANRFCGSSIMRAVGGKVNSSPAGPFQLFFNSDKEFDVPLLEIGFRLNYKIL